MFIYGRETFGTRMEDYSMETDVPRGWWAYVDPHEPMRVGGMVGVDEPETGEVTVRWLVVEDGNGVVARLRPELARPAGRLRLSRTARKAPCRCCRCRLSLPRWTVGEGRCGG